MNLLTFDIEEWALAKARGYGSAAKYAEYDGYLARILDILDERGFKGTFFCTGMMAETFPEVVRLIHGRGHEVGCHSHRHDWLNRMTEAEAREDTRAAVDALEQCIGQKIKSYRAPAFTIGKSNKWAFEILAQSGITRDASVYPAERDFGGFENFGQNKPCIVEYNGIKLKEYPVCTAKVLGKETAYSGGGFFRFFPLGFVKKQMSGCDYTMSYFHIWDLIPESRGLLPKETFESYYKTPGTFKNRVVRYFKSNLGKKRAFDKMMRLIATESFVNLDQADRMTDWEQAPSVTL